MQYRLKNRLLEVDEGNAFSKARQDAIDKHEDEFEVDGETYPVEGEKKYAFMEMKRLVREIIKEYALDMDEDMLPIPDVSYPIEIEEIIVDPVMDMILEPEELQAVGPEEMMVDDFEIMDMEPSMDLELLDQPSPYDEFDSAVTIDIDHGAVDPILDTIETVLGDEPSGSPKGSEYGRMTKGKLFRMGQMAFSLHDRLEDGQDIPEWTKDKISTAEDRLSSAYDYVDYKLHRMEQQGCSCNESHVRKFARQYLRR